jgi:hypothetical protein
MWRKTGDSMTIQHILYKFDWGAQVVLSSKQFVTTMYIYRSMIIPRLQWHWRHIHGENPVSPFLYYFFLFARFQLWSGALSIKSGSTFVYGSFQLRNKFVTQKTRDGSSSIRDINETTHCSKLYFIHYNFLNNQLFWVISS